MFLVFLMSFFISSIQFQREHSFETMAQPTLVAEVFGSPQYYTPTYYEQDIPISRQARRKYNRLPTQNVPSEYWAKPMKTFKKSYDYKPPKWIPNPSTTFDGASLPAIVESHTEERAIFDWRNQPQPPVEYWSDPIRETPNKVATSVKQQKVHSFSSEKSDASQMKTSEVEIEFAHSLEDVTGWVHKIKSVLQALKAKRVGGLKLSRVQVYAPSLPGNPATRHTHYCISCGVLYEHDHVQGHLKHATRPNQCPNEDCEWFNSSEVARTHARVVKFTRSRPNHRVKKVKKPVVHRVYELSGDYMYKTLDDGSQLFLGNINHEDFPSEFLDAYLAESHTLQSVIFTQRQGDSDSEDEEALQAFDILMGEAESKSYCCNKKCFKTPSTQVDGIACMKCKSFSYCCCKCQTFQKKIKSKQLEEKQEKFQYLVSKLKNNYLSKDQFCKLIDLFCEDNVVQRQSDLTDSIKDSVMWIGNKLAYRDITTSALDFWNDVVFRNTTTVLSWCVFWFFFSMFVNSSIGSIVIITTLGASFVKSTSSTVKSTLQDIISPTVDNVKETVVSAIAESVDKLVDGFTSVSSTLENQGVSIKNLCLAMNQHKIGLGANIALMSQASSVSDLVLILTSTFSMLGLEQSLINSFMSRMLSSVPDVVSRQGEGLFASNLSVPESLSSVHDTLSSFYDKHKTTWDLKRFTGIAGLISSLLGISIMGADSLKPLKTAVTNGEAIEKLWDKVEEYLNSLGFLNTGKWAYLREIESAMVGISSSAEQISIQMATAPSYYCRTDGFEEWCQFKKSVEKVEEICRKNSCPDMRNSKLFVSVQTMYAKVQNWNEIIMRTRASNGKRVEPVGICITGASQIGKSKLRSELCKRVTKILEETGKPSFAHATKWTTWNCQARDEYDQGYCGQAITYVDDGFADKAHKDHPMWLSFISGEAIGTVQANLADKGSPYLSRMCMVSCNELPVNSSTINNIYALHKRFPYTIRAQLKMGSSAPSVTEPYDPDFKHLQFTVGPMQEFVNPSDSGFSKTSEMSLQAIAEEIAANMILREDKFVTEMKSFGSLGDRVVTRQADFPSFSTGESRRLRMALARAYRLPAIQHVDDIFSWAMYLRLKTTKQSFEDLVFETDLYNIALDLFSSLSLFEIMPGKEQEFRDRFMQQCICPRRVRNVMLGKDYLYAYSINSGTVMFEIPFVESTLEVFEAGNPVCDQIMHLLNTRKVNVMQLPNTDSCVFEFIDRQPLVSASSSCIDISIGHLLSEITMVPFCIANVSLMRLCDSVMSEVHFDRPLWLQQKLGLLTSPVVAKYYECQSYVWAGMYYGLNKFKEACHYVTQLVSTLRHQFSYVFYSVAEWLGLDLSETISQWFSFVADKVAMATIGIVGAILLGFVWALFSYFKSSEDKSRQGYEKQTFKVKTKVPVVTPVVRQCKDVFKDMSKQVSDMVSRERSAEDNKINYYKNSDVSCPFCDKEVYEADGPVTEYEDYISKNNRFPLWPIHQVVFSKQHNLSNPLLDGSILDEMEVVMQDAENSGFQNYGIERCYGPQSGGSVPHAHIKWFADPSSENYFETPSEQMKSLADKYGLAYNVVTRRAETSRRYIVISVLCKGDYDSLYDAFHTFDSLYEKVDLDSWCMSGYVQDGWFQFELYLLSSVSDPDHWGWTKTQIVEFRDTVKFIMGYVFTAHDLFKSVPQSWSQFQRQCANVKPQGYTESSIPRPKQPKVQPAPVKPSVKQENYDNAKPLNKKIKLLRPLNVRQRESLDDGALELVHNLEMDCGVFIYTSTHSQVMEAHHYRDFDVSTGVSLYGVAIGDLIFCPSHICSLGSFVKVTPILEKHDKSVLFRQPYAVGQQIWRDNDKELCCIQLMTKKEAQKKMSDLAGVEVNLSNANGRTVYSKKLENHLMSWNEWSQVAKSVAIVQFLPTKNLIATGLCTYRGRNSIRVETEGKISIENLDVFDVYGVNDSVNCTVPGDCGGLICVMNTKVSRKVIGFHSFGGITSSNGTMLYKELVDEIKSQSVSRESNSMFKQVHVPLNPDKAGHGADQLYGWPEVEWSPIDVWKCEQKKTPINLPDGDDVAYVGTTTFPPVMTTSKNTDSSSHSGWHHSPFAGAFEIKTQPSPLNPSDKRIEPGNLPFNALGQPSLYKKPNSVMGRVLPEPDPVILSQCYDALFSYWQSVLSGEDMSVSDDLEKVLCESVNGRLSYEYLKPVNVKAGPGLPWSIDALLKKSDMIDVDEFGNRSYAQNEGGKKLKNLVGLKIKQAQKGQRIRSYCQSKLKNTLIKDSHVKIGKTRVYNASAVEDILMGNALFGPFKESFTKFGHMFNHAIGMNPHSLQWKFLFEKLVVHPNWLDVDYKNFDKHLPSAFMRLAYKLIIETIDKVSPDNYKLARYVFAEQCINSLMVDLDTIYMTEHSNKSGDAMTTFTNSIVNYLFMFYCFSKLLGKVDFAYFKENVSFCTMGDDIVMSVSNEVKDWFNFCTLHQALTDIGQEATSAAKTDDIQPFVDIDQVTFLKRRFLEQDGFVVGPLPSLVVESTFGWTEVDNNDVVIWSDIVRSHLLEAVLLGKEYYDYFRDRLRVAINRNNQTFKNRIIPQLCVSYEVKLQEYYDIIRESILQIHHTPVVRQSDPSDDSVVDAVVQKLDKLTVKDTSTKIVNMSSDTKRRFQDMDYGNNVFQINLYGAIFHIPAFPGLTKENLLSSVVSEVGDPIEVKVANEPLCVYDLRPSMQHRDFVPIYGAIDLNSFTSPGIRLVTLAAEGVDVVVDPQMPQILNSLIDSFEGARADFVYVLRCDLPLTASLLIRVDWYDIEPGINHRCLYWRPKESPTLAVQLGWMHVRDYADINTALETYQFGGSIVLTVIENNSDSSINTPFKVTVFSYIHNIQGVSFNNAAIWNVITPTRFQTKQIPRPVARQSDVGEKDAPTVQGEGGQQADDHLEEIKDHLSIHTDQPLSQLTEMEGKWHRCADIPITSASVGTIITPVLAFPTSAAENMNRILSNYYMSGTYKHGVHMYYELKIVSTRSPTCAGLIGVMTAPSTVTQLQGIMTFHELGKDHTIHAIPCSLQSSVVPRLATPWYGLQHNVQTPFCTIYVLNFHNSASSVDPSLALYIRPTFMHTRGHTRFVSRQSDKGQSLITYSTSKMYTPKPSAEGYIPQSRMWTWVSEVVEDQPVPPVVDSCVLQPYSVVFHYNSNSNAQTADLFIGHNFGLPDEVNQLSFVVFQYVNNAWIEYFHTEPGTVNFVASNISVVIQDIIVNANRVSFQHTPMSTNQPQDVLYMLIVMSNLQCYFPPLFGQVNLNQEVTFTGQWNKAVSSVTRQSDKGQSVSGNSSLRAIYTPNRVPEGYLPQSREWMLVSSTTSAAINVTNFVATDVPISIFSADLFASQGGWLEENFARFRFVTPYDHPRYGKVWGKYRLVVADASTRPRIIFHVGLSPDYFYNHAISSDNSAPTNFEGCRSFISGGGQPSKPIGDDEPDNEGWLMASHLLQYYPTYMVDQTCFSSFIRIAARSFMPVSQTAEFSTIMIYFKPYFSYSYSIFGTPRSLVTWPQYVLPPSSASAAVVTDLPDKE